MRCASSKGGKEQTGAEQTPEWGGSQGCYLTSAAQTGANSRAHGILKHWHWRICPPPRVSIQNLHKVKKPTYSDNVGLNTTLCKGNKKMHAGLLNIIQQIYRAYFFHTSNLWDRDPSRCYHLSSNTCFVTRSFSQNHTFWNANLQMDYCNIIKGTVNLLHEEALTSRGKESCQIDLYHFRYSKVYACS